MKRWGSTIVAVLGMMGPIRADELPSVVVPPVKAETAKPLELPPLGLPSSNEPFPGTPVSRPLTGVDEPAKKEPEPQLPTEAEMKAAEVSRPLGRSWSNYELLVWWSKAHPLPALVSASRGAAPPILGGPNTQVLVGNGAIDTPDAVGARFTFGYAVNDDATAGIQLSYQFLGTRTSTASVADNTAPARVVGRPIVNAFTSQPDFVPISGVNGLIGTVDVSTTTRVTGWDLVGVANLASGVAGRLNAIAGYRYFMVNEGLRIDQSVLFPAANGNPAVAGTIADQFDAHTRFHGGEFGLVADMTRGVIFLEASGKVSLGESIMVVRNSGQSIAISPAFPLPAGRWFQGGVLGQPTNFGRVSRSAFAVLPEATVKLGYRFRDRSRFYVGYNFLYLSAAVRPGDQVDTVVDPSQIPLFPKANPGGVTLARPEPVFARSDFWVQGLTFGVEYRY